jgi:transcription elongation factor GreB
VSRAFVKDDDDRPQKPPPRPIDSGRPNYVTPRGLELLHDALERARACGDERNVAYYETRLSTAIVVEPGDEPNAEVRFGSSVVLREQNGGEVRLRIVGEDEADPARGAISWISPYAQALMGHRAGERVVVQRPAGPASVAIESVK